MSWRAFLALLLATAASAAPQPDAASFSWHATLDTGGRSGLLRVALPGEALARLQSRDAADLRVFDAQGQPVAFALSTPALPAAAPRQETGAFAALPLFAAGPQAPHAGRVQLRIEQNGQQQTVWMDTGVPADSATPSTQKLPAAIFDTRAQKTPVSGLLVHARLPANAPVRIAVSTSPDLASWTPVPVQGRLYRFDGAGAPANERLEFGAPVSLQDRYLRVDWPDQPDVAVDAIAGLLAQQVPEQPLPAVPLPQPVAEGAGALEWQLGFATPLRQLELRTSRADTLVPVRVLGRNQPSEPWRPLGNVLVYRLGTGADETTNVPLELPHAPVRWLRIEATHGARLEGVPLAARAVFDPVEVVFAAGAAGPYQLAAGRSGTPAGALPVSMLASASKLRIEDLPVARIVQAQGIAPATPWSQRWLPRGVDEKTAGLWLVLALGVLLLAGVAWSLLRQLRTKSSGG